MERHESAVPQEIATVETDAASPAYAVRTAVGNMDTSTIANKASLNWEKKKPEDAAALPPLLTLPEKLVVVETAAPRLKEVLRLLIQRRKISDVWESWLYVLHLAAPGRPTRLGRALYKALKEGREPGRAYVEEAEKLWFLRWIIALEAAALDVGSKNELDALLAAYARRIPGVDLHTAYYAFRYMASDVRGISMAVLALPPEKIFELLGQL